MKVADVRRNLVPDTWTADGEGALPVNCRYDVFPHHGCRSIAKQESRNRLFFYKNRNNIQTFLHRNVAFVTYKRTVTQKPGLTTLYQYMSDMNANQPRRTLSLLHVMFSLSPPTPLAMYARASDYFVFFFPRFTN